MLKKMTKKQKKQFYKIVVAFVLLIVGVILPIPELYKLIFFIPGYLIVGYDVRRQERISQRVRCLMKTF